MKSPSTNWKLMTAVVLCLTPLLFVPGCGFELEGSERKFFESIGLVKKTAMPPPARPMPPARPPLTDAGPFKSLRAEIAFIDLGEFTAASGREDFSVIGRFEHARWPAKITRFQDANGNLTFKLKNGARHEYPASNGTRMRAVFLEDEQGGETVIVLLGKSLPTGSSQPPR